MHSSNENLFFSGEQAGDELFLGVDSSYGSGLFFNKNIKKTSHWSIPWADLMMTMFILFAVLFAYNKREKEVKVRLSRYILDDEQSDGQVR